MRKLVYLWVFISVLLAVEFYFLKQKPQLSILLWLQSKKIISEIHVINTAPGRFISLWLGWVGLGSMIIMNLYSMRKRLGFMQNMGRVSDWLNFHIFCGLLGPTLIVFHCDFKVRGIVGISFWSMVVSFSSGIIGRYFYLQLLRAKSDLEQEAQKKLKQIDTLIEKYNLKTTESDKSFILGQAMQFAGVPHEGESVSLMTAMFASFKGDLRIALSHFPVPAGWPDFSTAMLAEYAVAKRRASYLVSFQQLMGYWHAFHFPFAIFMYVVAAIHVAAALILGV